MITFLCAADNFVPLKRYFREWGRPLRPRFKQQPYEKLPNPKKIPDGTYIFCDVDRLDAANIDIARNVYTHLSLRGDRVRLLNSPFDSLPRYPLLRALHAQDINDFNVHPVDGPAEQFRFPVFIRSSRQHHGAFSERIQTMAQLRKELSRLTEAGHHLQDLIVVEYLETAQQALYRKYAATRVGDRMIAHHIMFERHWEVKGPSLVDADMLKEEREFQLGNPHREMLMKIFDIANIQYGRVDYAVLEGRLQVWEINTNPTLLYPMDHYSQEQMPAKLWFTEQLNNAFINIDDKSPMHRPWWSRVVAQ